MAKDAVETMGALLPDDVGGRDAVHVAVISAIASERLEPGEHVGFIGDKTGQGGDRFVGGSGKLLGIVDPFLSTIVHSGERFWLFIYPRTITGLHHIWTHPDLPEKEVTAEEIKSENKLLIQNLLQKPISEKWLRDFCAKSDCPNYKKVMEIAERVADGKSSNSFDDDYLHFNGSDAHGEIPPEFWDHVSVVLGKPIKGRRAKYFSCAC